MFNSLKSGNVVIKKKHQKNNFFQENSSKTIFLEIYKYIKLLILKNEQI